MKQSALSSVGAGTTEGAKASAIGAVAGRAGAAACDGGAAGATGVAGAGVVIEGGVAETAGAAETGDPESAAGAGLVVELTAVWPAVEVGDEGMAISADGARLPLWLVGLGSLSALTVEHLKKAGALLGLLRFDGGRWRVQPLAADLGKAGWVGVGDGAFEAVTKKRKKDTLKILRERASRLLRKKA